VNTNSDAEKTRIAVEILESEPFAWLMVGSNHTETQLAALRPAWAAYVRLGGGYFKYRTEEGK
jgi:hypothetical protein